MIRIRSSITLERALADDDEYLLPLASLLELLRNRGIQITPDAGEVVLANVSTADGPPTRPTIFVDRTDGGFLWWRTEPGEGQLRRLLNDPLTLGLLKVSRYRSLDAYDSPPTDRAFHARLIHAHHPDAVPLGNETVATSLSPGGYRKIRLVPGFWAFDECTPLAETPINFRAPRRLDVFCAVTVRYKCAAIAWHRRRALEILGALRDLRVMLGRGRVLPGDTYHGLLQEAKICVSPWGFGETSHRDYEALLAGCILIKPRTDFSDSLLPLDEGRHYFACRPDFADLPELITSILERWPALMEQRRANRRYVLAARRFDWLADRIAEELIAVVGDARSSGTECPL